MNLTGVLSSENLKRFCSYALVTMNLTGLNRLMRPHSRLTGFSNHEFYRDASRLRRDVCTDVVLVTMNLQGSQSKRAVDAYDRVCNK